MNSPAEPKPTKKSPITLVKGLVIVGAVLIATMAGAAYLIAPKSADLPEGAVTVITKVDVDNVDPASHRDHYHSHSHAHPASSHPILPVVKPTSPASYSTLFSKRNAAVLAVVIGLVVLLTAGCITAAVLFSTPTHIIEPPPHIEVPVVEDKSPQAVAECKLAEMSAELDSTGSLFWASAGLAAVVVTVISAILIGGCFCPIGWKKQLIVNGLLALAAAIFFTVPIVLSFIYQGTPYYYLQLAFYVLSGVFLTVSAFFGGPMLFGISLLCLSGVTLLFLIGASFRGVVKAETDDEGKIVDRMSTTFGHAGVLGKATSRIIICFGTLVILTSTFATVIFGIIDPIYWTLSVIPLLALIMMKCVPMMRKETVDSNPKA